MNSLGEFQKMIDESDFDVKDEEKIKNELRKAVESLQKAGDKQLLRNAELEQWAFAFGKDPVNGLTPKFSGTRKDSDGAEIPFDWPNQKEITKEDADYIFQRYKNCKNLFATTEYGLVLFYIGYLKDNREVIILLKNLVELSKRYYKNSLPDDDKKHYILSFVDTLRLAFTIANQRKGEASFKDEFKNLILFCTDVHNSWDVTHKSSLRSVIDLTDFAILYKRDYEELVSLEKYLDQNYRAALELSKTYNWGAIYICDVSQKLADKIRNEKYDWQTLTAEQYEAMIQPAFKIGNMAAVMFSEKALQIYKLKKNSVKVEELSKKYDELRRAFQMNETSFNLPEDDMKRIFDTIKKEVVEKTSQELVMYFALTPMFSSLEKVQETADQLSEQSVMASLFPTSILDKFGNTIDLFVSPEEKSEYQFYQAYDFMFQIASRTLMQLFMEAFKSGKLKSSDFIECFRKTWMGQKYDILYHGEIHEICPLDAIQPSIELYFSELEKWKANNEYVPGFICCTDSLVAKSEYILRFFCQRLGIATFVDKQKGNKIFKMERNIDEIFGSLEDKPEQPTGFEKEHLIYMKFILVKKMGYNLRHKVAHGLMDKYEYNLLNPLLMITIFLKLALYSIIPSSNDTENK
jgi:hypothetical protein